MPTCLVRHARLLVTMDAQHREHRFGLELGREGASLGHCGSPWTDCKLAYCQVQGSISKGGQFLVLQCPRS